MRHWPIAAAAIALLLGSTAAAAPRYALTDLGTLGGADSIGYAINAAGQVVGHADTHVTGDGHAFLYSAGSMQDLGTLLGPSPPFGSFGLGINDSGQITGSSWYVPFSSASHAILYEGGTMLDLGTLGGSESAGTGINNSGQISGFSELPGGAMTHAFLYDGVMQDLGTLGGTDSVANAINASGQVVGGAHTAGNAGYHAFIYSEGVMQDLGTLGGNQSEGRAINDAGQVAGFSRLAGNGSFHAFLHSGGVMQDLGTLGGNSSFALGINASGHVVGHSHLAEFSDTRAFLYDGSTMLDLNELIDPLSGWTLYIAQGINASGQITGAGFFGGRSRAFLLTPLDSAVPEPIGWALMICGFGLAGARLRRREISADRD